jgi:nucleoside-diphosphate-sugar epimerase
MKVFLAGATGAVGRPLLRELLQAGHDVVGTTRKPARARELERAGAEALVLDALETESLVRAVIRARPEVVIDQLTQLPQRIRPRGMRAFYRRQNLLRGRAGAALIEAARSAGARRLIAQSVAFIYAPNGEELRREDDPVWRDAPAPFGRALRIAADHDERVAACDELEGVVLRYGVFYGPGTHSAPGNGIYEDVRRRRFPVAGAGNAVWSFVHVEDAARATMDALGRGSAGIYNIVDDEPAPVSEWLPAYAEAIGARPPRRLPAWLVRAFAGPAMAAWLTNRPGAANQKAKGELGFSPRFASWRQGFREALA